MERRNFLRSLGTAGLLQSAAAQTGRTPGLRLDLHTHYYTQAFFENVRESGGDFSFDKSPTGQTIITHKGSRFFGITPPMTDVNLRIEAMDRVGIDIQVVSLSTPNIFYTDGTRQPAVARMMNNAYADLVAKNPKRFRAFASIPMDNPDEALKELHRTIGELKMNGVILLSNIGGKPLTSSQYRPFFAEANRMKLCIFLHPMLPVNSEPYKEYVLGPIIGFPMDTTLAVARMCYDGMFKDFPDIRWIIGHIGGAIPYLMERMDSGFHDFAECKVKIDQPPSFYLKKLYYDTVTFNPQNLMLTRGLLGSDHMVMGSDFPHLLGSIDRAVSSIEALNIPQAEKRQIFEGTALSILNNV
jgi:aminocarboxymuconate-semialdehyde decarboxylase